MSYKLGRKREKEKQKRKTKEDKEVEDKKRGVGRAGMKVS